MKTYALLCHPGMNRVYARRAAALHAQELWAAAGRNGIPIELVGQAELAGVDYLFFSCRDALPEDWLRIIAHLSFFFALFERLPGGALRPVAAQCGFSFPEDLVALLKYSGKTNEQFTHLMVNLAKCAGQSKQSDRPWLLDPLCGKGTTLFTAMRFGMNAAGIETRASFIQEGQTFLTKYLETGHYKHRHTCRKLSGPKGRKIADIADFSYAIDKEAFRSQDIRQVKFIHADTLLSGEILPRRRFDFLVADLPYGVQHKSMTHGNGSLVKAGGSSPVKACFSRNAVGLVDDALDGWLAVLKPGASLVMAYNSFTAPREALSEIFARHGLDVLTGRGYTGYSHRVGQSIERDLIVARKPG